jgi:RNA polymerase sigma-70 factor (ECF subfamily)
MAHPHHLEPGPRPPPPHPSRPSADQQITGTTEIAAVLAAIDLLPNKEREVLLLTAVEELTTTEIATILKRSESSVRSLIFRARTHLKQRLEKGGWR